MGNEVRNAAGVERFMPSESPSILRGGKRHSVGSIFQKPIEMHTFELSGHIRDSSVMSVPYRGHRDN
jgi:hypothetical protein